ncbi:enoyl-CoA hydratase/isomerase family protein [Variovorax sp. J31P179]|uniref:enoyl-CoA hydratase/isomerase family protein n=1 Tax=Variovorax sp. J31P179 TaxID=3053508 RepID=UPI00257641DA|nr:enoyl-CoA hydratase/isomerase family protein [Variovorax sp. J31P179]MDM0084734.1 enoyl-CoA hydratase/isomerase family protein [Variovorax sp. J31P179]
MEEMQVAPNGEYESPSVVATAEGRVATITLDRPRKGNSLSLALMRELRSALRVFQEDNELDMLLLQANGRHFCTGADVSWINAVTSGDAELWTRGIGELFALLADLHALDKPVIARVHGSAVGGGVAILALCDSVVTVADAKWSLPEIQLGMVPTVVIPALLERVSRSTLERLLFQDHAWNGTSALEMGLATHVVAEKDLDAAINVTLEHWRAIPIQTVIETKALLRQIEGSDFVRRLAEVRPAAMAGLHSEDAKRLVGAMRASRT